MTDTAVLSKRLTELETTIEHGLKTFVEVGAALLEIRDSRLYLESHATFENYCKERWGMIARRARQLISASVVVGNLEGGTWVPPDNESHTRPLTRLEPEQQIEAWQTAVATAPNGKVTRTHVESVVRDYFKPVKKREPKPIPIGLPAAKSPTLISGRAESIPIESETVDLIITSPPYNLRRDNWPMGGNGRQPRDNGIGYDFHDDNAPEGEYQDWQIEVLAELYRVAKRGASLFYNHKPRNVDGALVHPLDWLLRSDNPWTLRQEIIWDRGSTHNHSATLFWPEDERIYWFTKGKPTLPDRPVGMSTIWRFHGPVANTWHPAPFDDELPRRCIEAVGRDGITVLDPFSGSGSTLRVAIEYGYEAIGVDISDDYLTKSALENGWQYG